TELPGEVLQRLTHARTLVRERGDVAVAVRGHELGQVTDDGREVGALGHEVGVAVELDDRADVAVDDDVDRALGGLAVLKLGRLAQSLGAQPVHGVVQVAFRLLEGVLAVHHPGAGRFAQRRDVFGRVLSHSYRSPGSRWY